MTQIRHRYTGAVLFESGAKTVRLTLEEAIQKEANLREANLRGANLWRADLQEADLQEADLQEADLREADLREANLRGANLRRANLWWAGLWEADLQGANLQEANLRGADLRKANLGRANLWWAGLWGADLQGANLQGAGLRWADLREADLREADVIGTVLDPANAPNQEGDFETRGGWCVGYRTRSSQHVGSTVYDDGQTYTGSVFSTCAHTACHPGLYVYPTVKEVRERYPGAEIIRVHFRRKDLHGAGGKHRVREFKVRGQVSEPTDD